MYSPTTRLLTLLELLQSRGHLSGKELAEKLEVEVRSVRRYVMMLRDIGIPVESEKGRYGAYHLRRGFRLPPLMFTDPEILAVILGLMAVRRLGLTTPGVESAESKIERVLPEELRERVKSIQWALTLNLPANGNVSSEFVARFSSAAYQGRRLWIAYQGLNNPTTERAIDVYGLVYHGGEWYSVAHCHLRGDLRVFRLDRVQDARLLDDTFEMPNDFDALHYLLNSIASLPGMWCVEVLLKTTREVARWYIPEDMAILEDAPDGILMRCYSDNLDWMARYLVRSGLEMVIHKPPELRDALRQLAQRVLDMVG